MHGLGVIAARLCCKPVLRMRHLSTAIRAGLNSRLLYKSLADFVVTTSSSIAKTIIEQAKISSEKCICVATGMEPSELSVDPEAVKKFRESLGVQPGDCLVGSVCFVRSWKGINDFLRAAALLKDEPKIKWVIVGGGYVEQYKPLARELGLENRVIFTGHLDTPFTAIAALDIFALLSTAHEGNFTSQFASCLSAKAANYHSYWGAARSLPRWKNGPDCATFSPDQVAKAVKQLASDPGLRSQYGQEAHRLTLEKFTFSSMLERMEKIYTSLKVSDL